MVGGVTGELEASEAIENRHFAKIKIPRALAKIEIKHWIKAISHSFKFNHPTAGWLD